MASECQPILLWWAASVADVTQGVCRGPSGRLRSVHAALPLRIPYLIAVTVPLLWRILLGHCACRRSLVHTFGYHSNQSISFWGLSACLPPTIKSVCQKKGTAALHFCKRRQQLPQKDLVWPFPLCYLIPSLWYLHYQSAECFIRSLLRQHVPSYLVQLMPKFKFPLPSQRVCRLLRRIRTLETSSYLRSFPRMA